MTNTKTVCVILTHKSGDAGYADIPSARIAEAGVICHDGRYYTFQRFTGGELWFTEVDVLHVHEKLMRFER